MLTNEEQKEITIELGKYQQKNAAGLEALKVVQKHRGWISDESLRDVAQMVGMTDNELDSVATSYNHIFRKPVGRHIIYLCDSVTCWIKGYEIIVEHLMSRLGVSLGQTTADNRFTLLVSSCLGVCEQAPAMIIDNDLYVNLNCSKIDDILSKYE